MRSIALVEVILVFDFGGETSGGCRDIEGDIEVFFGRWKVQTVFAQNLNKHLKYLSNHRVFPHPNPTQESPLHALSNAPSFVRFHAAVPKIASTHNISPT